MSLDLASLAAFRLVIPWLWALKVRHNPRWRSSGEPPHLSAFTEQAPVCVAAVTVEAAAGTRPGCRFLDSLIATPPEKCASPQPMNSHSHGFACLSETKLNQRRPKRPQSPGHYLIPTWVRPYWSRWTETARNSPISSPVSLQITAPLKRTRPTKQASQFKINKQTNKQGQASK